MSRTYTHLLMHIVFSTKNRELLIDNDLKPELHAYLGGLAKALKSKAYAVNGMPDHVHMLINLSPTVSVSEALQFIKANSSGWVHERWPQRSSFAWQLGYGAVSVSRSNVHAVVQYILNQERHHKTQTFQEEYIALLRAHKIEFDERYLWD